MPHALPKADCHLTIKRGGWTVVFAPLTLIRQNIWKAGLCSTCVPFIHPRTWPLGGLYGLVCG